MAFLYKLTIFENSSSKSDEGVGIGPDGFGIGPDGFGIGPDGIGIGPDGFGIGPDGFGIGPDGFGIGPDGFSDDLFNNINITNIATTAIMIYSIPFDFLFFILNKLITTLFLNNR